LFSGRVRKRGGVRAFATGTRLACQAYEAQTGRQVRASAADAFREDTVITATQTVDRRVKNAVCRELEWDPAVDAGAIGVAAEGGSVTLTGYIDTYAGKLAAERSAKSVRGVRAVANDLEVRLKIERTDADIAADAARALAVRSTIPGSVQAVVHQAHVTLTGRVDWLLQKQEAEDTVRHIAGVRSVTNYIAVAAHAGVHDVQRRIVRALHRDADLDARGIAVTVSGDKAVLSGTVTTCTQRELAERAAANAPGIAHVDNRIVVEPVAVLDVDVEEDELC
jgi:osmotically-inducible protein OsmY